MGTALARIGRTWTNAWTGGQTRRGLITGGLRFDWIMALLFTWPIMGGYADAWAHNHLPLDNFFTPWHGILYSGIAVSLFTVIGVALWNRSHGAAWRQALPTGYGLSALGLLIIAVGGPGDLAWHTLFGIEKNFDAIFSPTHVILALGIGLLVSGPLRAGWHRGDDPALPRWLGQGPAIVSLALSISLVTLITQFAHPLVEPRALAAYATPSDYAGKAGPVLGIVAELALLVGFVLLALRRWRLVPGALTFVFSLNAVLLSFMRDYYALIPVAVGAGLAADALVHVLRPSVERPAALRLFAIAVPIVYLLLYFLALQLLGGVWWTIHTWLGAIVMTAVACFFLTYLVVPPALPRSMTPSGPGESVAPTPERPASDKET
jgi:hypothetical protein